MHWLIAEDETDIRNLVAMMCQVWGHTPMPFENGQKVWDWMNDVETGHYHGALPEFALMDIRMPGKKGYEISERMRTIPVLQNIPIVLMTAFVLSDDERLNMMRQYGVDHILNKPLPDFQQLNKTLHDIINKKKMST